MVLPQGAWIFAPTSVRTVSKIQKIFHTPSGGGGGAIFGPPGATPLFGGIFAAVRRSSSAPAAPDPKALSVVVGIRDPRSERPALPCEGRRASCSCAFAAESVGSNASASYSFPSEIMRLAHAFDCTDDRRPVKSAAETGTTGASAAAKSGRGSPRDEHPTTCRIPSALRCRSPMRSRVPTCRAPGPSAAGSSRRLPTAPERRIRRFPTGTP